jgi:hypothetical protein
MTASPKTTRLRPGDRCRGKIYEYTSYSNLGRALINAQPNSNCCQLDEGEIIGCELVVAGRNPTTLLDLIKEPFDKITSAVEVRAEADRPLAVPFWRNVG